MKMKTPKENLKIVKKPKGEDGHKTFSIRIKDEIVEKLDDIATKSNRSRNDLIGKFMEFAIEHCDVDAPDEN